jgi:hypothetical protein
MGNVPETLHWHVDRTDPDVLPWLELVEVRCSRCCVSSSVRRQSSGWGVAPERMHIVIHGGCWG